MIQQDPDQREGIFSHVPNQILYQMNSGASNQIEIQAKMLIHQDIKSALLFDRIQHDLKISIYHFQLQIDHRVEMGCRPDQLPLLINHQSILYYKIHLKFYQITKDSIHLV